MGRNSLSCLALSLALLAVSAPATVVVSTTAATATTAWTSTFGGGSLVVSQKASSGTGTGETLGGNAGDLFAQSFQGNGETLEGFGFLVNSTGGATTTFNLALRDYGTAGPIDTAPEFAAMPAPLVSASFTYNISTTSWLLFDFSGAEAVTLDATHYYSMEVSYASGTGGMTVVRLGGTDSTYSFGTAGKGIGATDYPNPDAFAGAGQLRDAIFGLYTTPLPMVVPEPSTYALLAAGLGVVLLLRRRR